MREIAYWAERVSVDGARRPGGQPRAPSHDAFASEVAEGLLSSVVEEERDAMEKKAKKPVPSATQQMKLPASLDEAIKLKVKGKL